MSKHKVPAGLVPRGGTKGESVLASGDCQQVLAFLGLQLHHSNLCLCNYRPPSLCVFRVPLCLYVQISLSYKDTSYRPHLKSV